jgi:hypothetical protein
MKPKQPIVRQGPRRRITVADANQICQLMVDCMLNESEACAHLGLDRQNWYQWKQANESKFSHVITRVRAARYRSLVKRIEKTGQTRQDWRADAHLLALADRARFNLNQVPSVGINVAVGFPDAKLMEAGRIVYGTEPKQIGPVPTPKLLGVSCQVSNSPSDADKPQ